MNWLNVPTLPQEEELTMEKKRVQLCWKLKEEYGGDGTIHHGPVLEKTEAWMKMMVLRFDKLAPRAEHWYRIVKKRKGGRNGK